MNALKTGLTGHMVLLPADDLPAYAAHVESFVWRYQPVGEECNLVQALADTEWRLSRIPSLEMSIYALGQIEFAGLFPNEEEAVRKALIEGKVFLVYQRQLNNLSIQEGRLRRQREKDTAALRKLQQDRADREKRELEEAAKQYIKALRENRPFEPAELGFEFSMTQIERRALALKPDLFAAREAEREEAA